MDFLCDICGVTYDLDDFHGEEAGYDVCVHCHDKEIAGHADSQWHPAGSIFDVDADPICC